MLEPRKKMYDKAGPRVAAALQKRNMEAYYCPTAAEAVEKVLYTKFRICLERL